jgi:serine/threonine protein kinase
MLKCFPKVSGNSQANRQKEAKFEKDLKGYVLEHFALNNRLPSSEEVDSYAQQKLSQEQLPKKVKAKLVESAKRIVEESTFTPAHHGGTLSISTAIEKNTWYVPGTPPRQPNEPRDLFQLSGGAIGAGATATVGRSKRVKNGIVSRAVVKKSNNISSFEILSGERKALKDWQTLNNPNIVKYHGSYSHFNKMLIFEEECEGSLERLATLLHERAGESPLDKKILVYSAVDQLLNGVAALHQASISHLDIKPDNVMYTHDGIIKIVDAGTSGSEELVPTGSSIGSPRYMAPELQFQHNDGKGECSPFACDAYSLGVTIQEVLEKSLGSSVAKKSRLYQAAEKHLLNADPHLRMSIQEFRENLRSLASTEKIPVLDMESLSKAFLEKNYSSGQQPPVGIEKIWQRP